MFGPSCIPFWTAIAALAGVGQVLLLSVTAFFVYRYLQETKHLRIAAQRQVEAAFRPAIIIKHEGSLENIPTLENIGNGPAMEVSWSLSDSDFSGDIPFVQAHQPAGVANAWDEADFRCWR